MVSLAKAAIRREMLIPFLYETGLESRVLNLVIVTQKKRNFLEILF